MIASSAGQVNGIRSATVDTSHTNCYYKAMSTHRLILLAIICCALALRAAAFFLPHVENDEVIYRTLAEKLTRQPLDYSLQGTDLLSRLPAQQYDHPVFRHPPLFFYLLAVIYKLVGTAWGMLLPVISGTLIIFIGYLIGRRLLPESEALLGAAVMACCPILLLTSARLWIDTTSVLFMALSLYLFLIGTDEEQIIYPVISGVVLAAALLSKYISLGIIPALAAIAFCTGTQPAPAFRKLGITLGVCALCVVPWLIWYRTAMGGFSYAAHFRPTEEYLQMFPFVKRSFEQPWHAYIVRLFLISPASVFALLTLRKGSRNKKTAILWIWTLAFICGFILLLRLRIIGYALRYLLPASIPLSLLTARGILSCRKNLPIALPLLGYQLLTGILNAFIFYNADVFFIF